MRSHSRRRFLWLTEFLIRAVGAVSDERSVASQTAALLNPTRSSTLWWAGALARRARFFFDLLLAARTPGFAFCCGTSSSCGARPWTGRRPFPPRGHGRYCLLSLKLEVSVGNTVYLTSCSAWVWRRTASRNTSARGAGGSALCRSPAAKGACFGSAHAAASIDFAVRCVLIGRQLSVPHLMALIAPIIPVLRDLRSSNSSAGVLDYDALRFARRDRAGLGSRAARDADLTDAAQLLSTLDAMEAAAAGVQGPKDPKFK